MCRIHLKRHAQKIPPWNTNNLLLILVAWVILTKNNFRPMATNSDHLFDQVWLRFCLECATVGGNTGYVLRNAGDLRTVLSKKAKLHNSFVPKTTREWNSLPVNIQNAVSNNCFKVINHWIQLSPSHILFFTLPYALDTSYFDRQTTFIGQNGW